MILFFSFSFLFLVCWFFLVLEALCLDSFYEIYCVHTKHWEILIFFRCVKLGGLYLQQLECLIQVCLAFTELRFNRFFVVFSEPKIDFYFPEFCQLVSFLQIICLFRCVEACLLFIFSFLFFCREESSSPLCSVQDWILVSLDHIVLCLSSFPNQDFHLLFGCVSF